MTLLEASLIVIVLILLCIIAGGVMRNRSPQKGASGSGAQTWDCMRRGTGEMDTVQLKLPSRREDPESHTTAENAEYFTGCPNMVDESKPVSGTTGGEIDYSVQEYGAPGLTYSDWVTSQALDKQVLINHAEFVADRLDNNNQTVTGRTYSPDMHMSYDPIPWQGLRRPQAVATCNPTQIPDVDYSLYDQTTRLRW